MRYQTSAEFEAYARTLRRVFWSEFIDRQMEPVAGMPATPVQSQPSAPATLAVYPLPKQIPARR